VTTGTSSHAFGPKSLGFRAFLGTQFLGAFNDNVFRFTLIFYVLASVTGGEEQGRWLGINQAIFAVPFLVFAALAGSLADRWSKTRVIRHAKLAEVLVMLAGVAAFAADSLPLLTVVLFLMATQSAFFGPGKYGLLAETLHEGELVKANALVQLTTMLAIVSGQLVGGVLYDAYKTELASAVWWCVGFAVLGYASAQAVPRVPPARPEGKPVWNPLPDLAGTWRGVRSDRTLLFTMLGNAHYFLLVAALQITLAAYGEGGLGMEERSGAAALVATATVGIALGAMLASRWSAGRVELGLVPLGALTMALGLALVAVADPIPLDLLPASWAPGESAGAGGILAWLGTTLSASLWGLVQRGLWAPFAATGLLGLAGGLYVVPIMALLQKFAPAKEKGRYLAFSNMVGFLGIALSSLLLWIPGELGWSFQARFLLLAVLALLGGIVCLRLLPFAFVRLLAWLLAHSCYRIRVLHGERLPETGGALLLVNHVSWVDALVLGASTDRKVHFLMYRSYYEWWPTRWLFKLLGSIPVASGDRPEVTAASLRGAGELLEQGRVVAVFGEGAVTRLGHLLPFRTGYQRIIEGRDVPIVPVYLGGLWGSVLSHRGGRFLKRLPSLTPRPVTVAYGHPLPPDTEPEEARTAIQRAATEAWTAQERSPLHTTFARTARRDLGQRLGDETGLRLSPAGLLARAQELSRVLAGRFAPGEPVAVPATPGLATAVSVLALLRRRCVPVLVDPLLDGVAAAERARAAGARAWLAPDGVPTPPGLTPCLLDLAAVGRGARWRRWLGLARGLLPSRRGGRGADAPAAVVFGDDGAPRTLTHAQLSAEVEGLCQVLDLGADDTLLGVRPWSSAYGLATGLWLPLLSDCGALWAPASEARTLARLTDRSRASVLFTTADDLERYTEDVRPDGFGGLRLVIVAGGSLGDARGRPFFDRFGLIPCGAWAPDGAAGIVSLNIPDVRQPGVFQRGTRIGTVGHPIPGVHAVAVGSDGEPLPAGQVGRLQLTGPAACASANTPCEPDGVRGSVDDEGFITLVDEPS
jgi:acyl-[acyl-carrier-protein]-phospholipid O-acyltransferase/long-chain-fatty-acid--[acyl-carrier-protein] ligase